MAALDDGSSSASPYFDNASTAWPKHVDVAPAMERYQRLSGVGMGRSISRVGDSIGAEIAALRKRLAADLVVSAEEIFFCQGATDALNLLLQGLLVETCLTGHAGRPQEPELVLVSQIEHNSVWRPLRSWEQKGIVRLEMVPCDPMGLIDFRALSRMLEKKPLLVCVSHASNVTGQIQPLDMISQACRQTEALLLVDAAQTIGLVDIDLNLHPCDFLVASGHKGLRGPLGTGFGYARKSAQSRVASLRLGGTGNISHNWWEPQDAASKWEAGHLNIPGLVGLAAACDMTATSPAEMRQARWESMQVARSLCAALWEQLATISSVRLLADPGENPFVGACSRIPIVSLTMQGWDPAELAMALESGEAFVTRAGFHCAPEIHAALGTEVGGTLRLSPSAFNTPAQVERLVQCLQVLS